MRTALASVVGIYLITDTRDGRQYVGKADGADNIQQRWSAYAANGHGGNVKLRNLNPSTFRWSLPDTGQLHARRPSISTHLRVLSTRQPRIGSRWWGSPWRRFHGAQPRLPIWVVGLWWLTASASRSPRLGGAQRTAAWCRLPKSASPVGFARGWFRTCGQARVQGLVATP